MYWTRDYSIWFFLIVLMANQHTLQAQQKSFMWCDAESAYEILTQESLELYDREAISIPVVVHIVYIEDIENLSKARITSQIDVLNEDYNNLAINRESIPEKYKDLVADMEITFCLAHTDPDGNYTSGITRTSTDIDNIGIARDNNNEYIIHQESKGGVDAWDPNLYLNIWVADMGGLLGRSSFPWTADKTLDGVVIDPRYFGRYESSINPQGISLGRTATHEVGHYLGLYHLHGTENNDCNSDDMVSDTPSQASPNFGCPAQEPSSCGSADMYMNFMDLTNDPCLKLFTKGQKQRVDEFILQRSDLINSDKCVYGINSPKPTGEDHYYLIYDPLSQSANLSIVESSTSINDIYVFDSAGKLVAKQEGYSGTSFIFSTQNWAKGIYFCLISDEEKIKENLKLLIY